jgi:hypothetical protein
MIQNRVLGRIHGVKVWLDDILYCGASQSVIVKNREEMGEACSTERTENNSKAFFRGKPRKKETIRKSRTNALKES